MDNKKNIFKNSKAVIILAFLCAFGWALAYPLIKLGMQEFQISSDDTGSKILFAGLRFFFAGIAVIITGLVTRKSFRIGRKVNWLWLIAFALVNTAIHYLCSYIGLSHMTSSRSIIIESTGSFILIILSCVLFNDDRFTALKVIGSLLGFAGIVVINIDTQGNIFADITFSGDGMLFISALCSAFGGILTRIVTRNTDPTAATGISMTMGGAVLLAWGILFGGKITVITISGLLILVALISISAVCFGIYNQLLCYNPISKIAIFNALIPVLSVVASCIMLGEPFDLRYIFAGLLVAAGVYVINRK